MKQESIQQSQAKVQRVVSSNTQNGTVGETVEVRSRLDAPQPKQIYSRTTARHFVVLDWMAGGQSLRRASRALQRRWEKIGAVHQ